MDENIIEEATRACRFCGIIRGIADALGNCFDDHGVSDGIDTAFVTDNIRYLYELSCDNFDTLSSLLDSLEN